MFDWGDSVTLLLMKKVTEGCSMISRDGLEYASRAAWESKE